MPSACCSLRLHLHRSSPITSIRISTRSPPARARAPSIKVCGGTPHSIAGCRFPRKNHCMQINHHLHSFKCLITICIHSIAFGDDPDSRVCAVCRARLPHPISPTPHKKPPPLPPHYPPTTPPLPPTTPPARCIMCVAFVLLPFQLMGSWGTWESIDPYQANSDTHKSLTHQFCAHATPDKSHTPVLRTCQCPRAMQRMEKKNLVRWKRGGRQELDNVCEKGTAANRAPP